MIILAFINKSNIHDVSTAPKKGLHLSTKFEIGDFVYVMHENNIHTGKIVRIECLPQHDEETQQHTIIYTLELPDIWKTIQLPEDLCFESREEVIANL